MSLHLYSDIQKTEPFLKGFYDVVNKIPPNFDRYTTNNFSGDYSNQLYELGRFYAVLYKGKIENVNDRLSYFDAYDTAVKKNW